MKLFKYSQVACVVILIGLLPLGVFAQKQHGLTLSGGWNYSYRLFSGTDNKNFGYDWEGNDRRSDQGVVNFRNSIHYHSELGERLFLQVGLGFSRIGISHHPSSYLPSGFSKARFRRIVSRPQALNPREGFITSHQFLSFPVSLRFMGKPRRWTSFFEGGIIYQYYLNTRYSYDNFTDRSIYFYQNRTSQFLPLQLSVKVAMGSQYQWFKRIQAFFQLEFRYHLTPLHQTEIKEYLYNGGIEMGLRYVLNS